MSLTSNDRPQFLDESRAGGVGHESSIDDRTVPVSEEPMGTRILPPSSQSLLDPARTGADIVGELATARVDEAMDRHALVLPADASADVAAQLLIARGTGGAPVIDEERRLVGFVTTGDLLRLRDELATRGGSDDHGHGAALTRDGRTVRLGRGFHVVAALDATTVDSAMTPFVYALPRDASLARAIALMSFEGVRRLPIIDRDRRVVGVVSALDVLRWLRRRAQWPDVAELVRRAERARDEPSA